MSTFLDILAPSLVSVAAAVVSAGGAWGVTELRRRGVNTTIIEAVGRGAGVAYTTLVQSGQSARDPAALANAVQAGAAYVLDRVPQMLARADVSPAGAAAMVQAEVGKLLAADPAVSVTAGASSSRPGL